MAENIDVFDFALTDEQMARIASMDTGASLFFDTATRRWSAASAATVSTTDHSTARCSPSTSSKLPGRWRVGPRAGGCGGVQSRGPPGLTAQSTGKKSTVTSATCT
jgi:hypothetical protein